MKIFKEHIIYKLKEVIGKKIHKIADSIKRNVNYGSKIWKLKEE